MEEWLANIVNQFFGVKKVSVTWEGVRWPEGYSKALEEKLLKDSLKKMCRKGTEISTAIKQLW